MTFYNWFQKCIFVMRMHFRINSLRHRQRITQKKLSIITKIISYYFGRVVGTSLVKYLNVTSLDKNVWRMDWNIDFWPLEKPRQDYFDTRLILVEAIGPFAKLPQLKHTKVISDRNWNDKETTPENHKFPYTLPYQDWKCNTSAWAINMSKKHFICKCTNIHI